MTQVEVCVLPGRGCDITDMSDLPHGVQFVSQGAGPDISYLCHPTVPRKVTGCQKHTLAPCNSAPVTQQQEPHRAVATHVAGGEQQCTAHSIMPHPAARLPVCQQQHLNPSTLKMNKASSK